MVVSKVLDTNYRLFVRECTIVVEIHVIVVIDRGRHA